MDSFFQIGISLFLVPIGFFFMEGLSWVMHKYLQHGPLWILHQDHHKYTKGKYEKNDVFSLFFSILTMVFLVVGVFTSFLYVFWFGLGIFVYGMGFFLYHDIVFHRRIKVKYKPKNRYVKRVINAHRIHHQKSTANSGVSFGFFIVGKQYDPD